MIETAFVLPILLLILFAMLYLGMLLYTHIVVQLAAAQGARVMAHAYAEDPAGTESPTPDESARGFVRSVIASGLSQANLEAIQITHEPIANEDAIRVTVAYRFQLMVPFMSEWGASPNGGGLMVVHSSIFRVNVVRP